MKLTETTEGLDPEGCLAFGVSQLAEVGHLVVVRRLDYVGDVAVRIHL